MPQDANQVERAPLPPHRHAAPSGPWPWMDLSSTIRPEQLSSEQPPVPPLCDHTDCKGACWKDYPRSRFPNWEKAQTQRAKINEAIASEEASKGSVLYIVDTDRNGIFHGRKPVRVARTEVEDFWNQYLLKEVRLWLIILVACAHQLVEEKRREGSMSLCGEYGWSCPSDAGRKARTRVVDPL